MLDIESVAKLELHPGDTLVIKGYNPISAEQLDAFKQALSKHVGFPVLLAFFELGTEVSVVRPKA